MKAIWLTSLLLVGACGYGSLQVTQHGCGFPLGADCTSVVLDCASGVLRAELGMHSAKVWCEPADGGAR